MAGGMTLKSKKKASRVADEEFAAGGGAAPPPSHGGASLLCAILLAPLSLFSCLSSPRHITAPDGVWASEMPHASSDLTHLMVRDSLRYAILM